MGLFEIFIFFVERVTKVINFNKYEIGKVVNRTLPRMHTKMLLAEITGKKKELSQKLN